MSTFLPERHPVRDFFVLDAFDAVPRSDMASMEHPIYSLTTKPDLRSLCYEHEDAKIEIIPGSRGLPTVIDKDILIYCISKLMHLKNMGKPIGPKVRLTTYDLLVSTNRQTNNLGYERLEAALERLAGTVIKTTIETGDETTVEGFALISSFKYNRKGSMHAERLRYLEITLSEWIFRAIDSADVLPISRDYFRLRKPMDRRLYELARKHCGSKDKWRIGVDKLQKKVGSCQERKHFMKHMREVAAKNYLPDYLVELDYEFVIFHRRETAEAKAAPPPPAPAVETREDREKPRSAVPKQEAQSEPRKIFISSAAIERVREMFPRIDVYWLENTYTGWAADKELAKNEDARFLKWAQSFMKKQPTMA
ncbi:MAG: replication initiator protein A [Rhodomicrobium sp.]